MGKSNPTPLHINSIINRIKDTSYQQLYSKIKNSPRLQTYAPFKHTFEFENYLDFIRKNIIDRNESICS